MQDDKLAANQIDIFNKLILDLENINVSIDDEDQALFYYCYVLYLGLICI